MLLKSKESKVVFVALTQHLMQTCENCIKWPLTPARREGYCVSLPSWGFSCSPVSLRRQLCKLSWTCQTTRVIADTHSQSPILTLTKGVLSNPVILTYLWEQSCILHTLTKTACLCKFWSEKCLQCLKNVGLYNSFGIGRFSLWHSWLTRASRLANSQASASNAGVPGDPNSPESNCSYLALIWSVKELYSLCASCTVNKETGFGMTDRFQCNVEGVERSTSCLNEI